MNTSFIKVVGSLFAGYILVKLYKKVKYIEKAVHNIDVNTCNYINEQQKNEPKVNPYEVPKAEVKEEVKEEPKVDETATKENFQKSTKIDNNVLELNKFLDNMIDFLNNKGLGEEEK